LKTTCKINLELRPASDCFWAATTADSGVTWTYSSTAVSTPSLQSCSLFVDYIYLDTDERRRFAQVSHEYLIEQLQYTGEESTNTASNKIKLNFNHPKIIARDKKEMGLFRQKNKSSSILKKYATLSKCGNLLKLLLPLYVLTYIKDHG
jgi:hypothetical protein